MKNNIKKLSLLLAILLSFSGCNFVNVPDKVKIEPIPSSTLDKDKNVNNAKPTPSVTPDKNKNVTISVPEMDKNTPTSLNITNIKSNGFTISWGLVNGSTSYEIVIDDGTPININNGTSYTVTGLSSGSSHTWKIRVVKDGIKGDWSELKTVLTALEAPVVLNTISVTSDGFTIGWGLVSEATSYEIVIDDGTPININNGTSYTVTGLTPGSSHTWKVRVVKNGIKGDLSIAKNVVIEVLNSASSSYSEPPPDDSSSVVEEPGPGEAPPDDSSSVVEDPGSGAIEEPPVPAPIPDIQGSVLGTD